MEKSSFYEEKSLVGLTPEDDVVRKYVSSANIEKPERVNNSFSLFFL